MILQNPTVRFFRINPQISKKGRRTLKFGTVEKHRGQADVYYSTAVILNRNRVPGSRAKGKNNSIDGKGESWEGQREENWTEGIETPAGRDNYQAQEEFGNEGGDNYQCNWGIRPMMFYTHGEIADPQAI